MPCNPIELAPGDEAARLAALRDYRAADDGREHRFHDIAALASRLCSAPVAFVSLVAKKLTFVESAVGIASARAARADAFCRHALRQHGVFEVADTAGDGRFREHLLVAAEPHIRFFAAAPLVSPYGHAVGALCVAGPEPRQLSIEQAGALQILARQAVAQLELGVLALRDPLTGLFNRACLDASLQRELARATRYRSGFAVIALAVDHIRKINDTYGHEAGDAALRAVGALLPCTPRTGSIACRLAGRKFMVVMPGATAYAAAARAETLRQMAASLELQFLPGVRQRMSVSVGIAACPDHGCTPEEILAAADHALRLAKAKGRNCVVAARELDFHAMVAAIEPPASIAAEPSTQGA